MTEPKHFLDLNLLKTADLRIILKLAAVFKKGKEKRTPLDGKTLAMIFEKPSTRTRISFDVAMKHLGGNTILLNQNEMQIGRGETIADTSRVLSRYVDAIVLRTGSPQTLYEFAENSSIPVINALTDRSHPCQLLADVMTFEEHRGPILGKTIAWCGDGNNMALTWLHAAVHFDFTLRLACPRELEIPREEIKIARNAGATIIETNDPAEAVDGVHCVVTDTWVSMGDEKTKEKQLLLKPYQVDEVLMKGARPDAIFMHCLPAHRGKEATAGVLDGPHSVIWDEAENRLHAQKGILIWCLK